MSRTSIAIASVLAVVGLTTVSVVIAQPAIQPATQPATQPASQAPTPAPTPAPSAPRAPGNTGAGFATMLMQGLKSVDGCLGAEAAQTQSGKNVIIAWFRDAKAARDWYNHPAHRRMVGMVGANPDDNKPLEHVADGIPVMVMATITPSDKPEIEGFPMPISQISIELYAPLPGGAAINGRFAPEAFPVEHMQNY